MQSITVHYPASFPIDGMPESGQVLAIGEFDGLHLGHREVIRRAVETARKRRLPAAIMTFHPHPREVLGHEQYMTHITPLQEKLDLFEQAGVDVAYIVTFDSAFSQVSPSQFVNDMLVRLQVDTVVVGFDFRFGHKGGGDANALRELADGRFAVEVVSPCHMDGVKVSSTLIRNCLEQGDVSRVQQLLGRYYSLTGKVVHGAKRGRLIGYPTANIEPDGPFIVPANGVYAIRLYWMGQPYSGVMNIGTKPTFEGDSTRRTLEAHLFDFSQTIYGESVKVELVAFIREERKFPSVDDLIAQIRRDADEAKALLVRMADSTDIPIQNGK